MRFFCILCILGLNAPLAHAYPEYPPFEQTQFADDFGVFRWWQSCWWRVIDPNVYLICQSDGQILLLFPDGTIRAATEEELKKLFSLSPVEGMRGRKGVRQYSRDSERRLSPATGDGFRLSDVYGGTFTRFGGGSSSTGVFRGFGGFGGSGGRFGGFGGLGTGVFSFDRDGNPIDRDSNGYSFGDRDYDRNTDTWRFGGDGSGGRFSGTDRDRNTDTWRFGGDGSGGRFSGTRMDDIFYQPLGFGCDSIYDSIDTDVFGPAPCTSYPNVFGPVPRY